MEQKTKQPTSLERAREKKLQEDQELREKAELVNQLLGEILTTVRTKNYLSRLTLVPISATPTDDPDDPEDETIVITRMGEYTPQFTVFKPLTG